MISLFGRLYDRAYHSKLLSLHYFVMHVSNKTFKILSLKLFSRWKFWLMSFMYNSILLNILHIGLLIIYPRCQNVCAHTTSLSSKCCPLQKITLNNWLHLGVKKGSNNQSIGKLRLSVPNALSYFKNLMCQLS